MKKIVFGIILLIVLLLFFGCTTQPSNSQEATQQQSIQQSSVSQGCKYNNPSCESDYNCVNNQCTLKLGCQYNNPNCNAGSNCINNKCVLTVINSVDACINQSAGRGKLDIFDSHVHIMSKVSTSQIISEMDKAGVSMSLLYPIDGDDDSSSLEAISKYPGRFIAFVDTPDSPEPSTWLTQGQAFVRFAEAQLKTGKFYGIGETNLRYYSGDIISPPTVYVPADNSVWLALVDLSAKYHVPISFHFVPDDSAANVAFEKMLSHNKDAILIWAHLGFNNMPLDSAKLNDFLLRYPNLYFDTAGIQNMQNPLPQSNSNWALLTSQSDKGQLKEEWRQFFQTWNSRILFGSDAGGGQNGLERWLNYSSNTSDGAPADAIGHWMRLFSNLEYSAARNILSGNARTLFLKEQKPPYDYLISSGDECHHILVSSASSVSALAFNQSTSVITFTVADSSETNGSAVITIPAMLAKGNFMAFVDGQSVSIKEESNSTNTIITVEYSGGIKTITLKGKKI
ncbi:MAG: amidohydrolase family protein [archaeon]|jgi:hypothetical protein